MRISSIHIAAALIAGVATMLVPDASTPVRTPSDSMRAQATGVPSESMSPYDAMPSGDPYDVLAADSGTQGEQGAVAVTVIIKDPSVPAPVYVSIHRFYSAKSGTHFYTPFTAERDHVMRTWPNVWAYEGVAYVLNQATNTQPLYRFWNRFNGAHFYTASATERDMVISRWPEVFAYEGRAYNVSLTPTAGSTTVYRFYNRKNGSHFYTASNAERDMVISRWSGTYQLEGPAFWLAP